MKRLLTAALTGGIIVFCWGAISHMALGLGETGISMLASEAPVVEAMKQNIPQSGLYFIPGMTDRSEAGMKAWEEKIRSGPFAILIYTAGGQSPMEPTQLATEFLSNLVAALVASFLLMRAAPALPGYASRVIFVALLGLLPGLDIDVSYWNWYRFPANYTLAQMLDHFVAWTLAGLAMAKIHRG
jgi:hypothetical protein